MAYKVRGDSTWDWLYCDSPWWLKAVLIVGMALLLIIGLILLPAMVLAEKWSER